MPLKRIRMQSGVGWPAGLILLLSLISYLPAMTSAGFIWDDPDYVLNNRLLRTWEGLWTIWTSPSSLPQYYPLVHTTYWVEYRLVGLSPHLYHVTNVLLHAGSGVLLYLLLRRLGVAGALLAACVFVVHPVMVESVAWVTERKNTLSMFLYLGAFLAYWEWWEGSGVRSQGSGGEGEGSKRWGGYAVATALFVLALLSKTVTCSLPAAILVVLWWKGRLSWRAVGWLVPWFAVGAGLGLYTAYLERTHVGAFGAEFDLSAVDRVLIASRAVMFYAGKLVLPFSLSFIYPRWEIDAGDLVQWVPVVACVGVTAVLCVVAARGGRRGPLAAWLLYVGTLVPALGFFDVYPMRYSFVADHFQYHAAPAMIALLAAGVARWSAAGGRRARAVSEWRVVLSGAPLLVALGVATFQRCRVYESALTLWEDTARKNPGSWMVRVNLGHALVAANQLDAAHEHYGRAVELGPGQPEALINLGGILAKKGRHGEAMEEYRRALAVNPEYPLAQFGMGSSLLAQGDVAGAVEWLKRAVEKNPDYAQAHYTLGRAYERMNDPELARRAYEAAVAADPDDADALYNLGTLYLTHGRAGEAVESFRRAVAIRPERADYRANLASAYLKAGDGEAALREYAEAARLDPALGAQIREFLKRRGIVLP